MKFKWNKITNVYFELLCNGYAITVDIGDVHVSYYKRNKVLFAKFEKGRYYKLIDKKLDFMEICEDERKKAEAMNLLITKARKRFMRIKTQYDDVVAHFTTEGDYEGITFKSAKACKVWTDIKFKGYFAFPYIKVRDDKVFGHRILIFSSDPNQELWRNDAKKFYGDRAIELIEEHIREMNLNGEEEK